MKTKKGIKTWKYKVKKLLISIGYKKDLVLSKEWESLYEDNIPFQAINESEFNGSLTWNKFLLLQKQKQHE